MLFSDCPVFAKWNLEHSRASSCYISSPLVALEMDTQPLYDKMVVLRH